MSTNRSITAKILIVVGAVNIAALVSILLGYNVVAFCIYGAGLVICLWFTRRLQVEDEVPCSSVSCCHYLGDDKDR